MEVVRKFVERFLRIIGTICHSDEDETSRSVDR